MSARRHHDVAAMLQQFGQITQELLRRGGFFVGGSAIGLVRAVRWGFQPT
jgi:hypothetical protein